MTPAEEKIRAALAAGPTPGPWLSAAYGDYGDYDGKCRVILGEGGDIRTAVVLGFDTPENAANAQLIAACNPASVAELLAELNGERNRAQMFADLVRGVAMALHGEGWSDTSKLAEEVARLRAEVEALKADGERLDYIASNARCDPKMDGQHVWWPTSFNHRLVGPNLRAAIDAAKGGE